MAGGVRHHLPLLAVLKHLTPDQRQIIIDHLDHAACDSIGNCFTKVMKHQRTRGKAKDKKLVALVRENERLISQALVTAKSLRSRVAKRSALAKLGGNPLGFILATALPLLVDLIRK